MPRCQRFANDNAFLPAAADVLMLVVQDIMGVHQAPCASADDYNLELYSEFVQVRVYG